MSLSTYTIVIKDKSYTVEAGSLIEAHALAYKLSANAAVNSTNI